MAHLYTYRLHRVLRQKSPDLQRRTNQPWLPSRRILKLSHARQVQPAKWISTLCGTQLQWWRTTLRATLHCCASLMVRSCRMSPRSHHAMYSSSRFVKYGRLAHHSDLVRKLLKEIFPVRMSGFGSMRSCYHRQRFTRAIPAADCFSGRVNAINLSSLASTTRLAAVYRTSF